MSQLPPKLSMWLSEKQLVIEIVLVVLVGFSCALKFLHLEGADEALMITMLTLAAFYFLLGFVSSDESQFVQIPSKIFSIASAVCVIGLLFIFLHLPGAKEQILIGLISLGVSGVAMIFLVITGRAQKFTPMLIRMVILGGLSLNAFMGLSSSQSQ